MSSSTGSGNRHAPIEAFLSNRQFVIVSNREPYCHDRGPDGIEVSRPAGGLTAALDPVLQSLGGTWVAWGSGSADRQVVDDDDTIRVPPEDPSYDLRRVWLEDEDVDGYYYGFSNQVLWPLCHSLPSKVEYDPTFWETYRDVNDQFAAAVADTVESEDAVVWLQDYHFGLAPRLVRDRLGDDVTLAHFWHIPWPPWDVFQRCPHGPELLTALLSNDLLGFHTSLDVQQFGHCAKEMVDAEYDEQASTVTYDGHTTVLRAAPIQIDAKPVAERARSDAATAFWTDLAEEHDLDDVAVLLGVDRLDYTKGIPQRLDALELLWEEYPSLQGEISYVQKGSESRSEIPAYAGLQDEVQSRIEEINERFGTDDWQPIVYFTEHLSLTELNGLYRHADVALVTPVRDGLNLVAKEFVAGTKDGVLVLSDAAGVADELGEYALSVTPMDVAVFTERIKEALDLPPEGRIRHTSALKSIVGATHSEDWLRTFFAPLAAGDDADVDEVSTISE